MSRKYYRMQRIINAISMKLYKMERNLNEMSRNLYGKQTIDGFSRKLCKEI